jgi:hypothetical protein
MDDQRLSLYARENIYGIHRTGQAQQLRRLRAACPVKLIARKDLDFAG